MNWKVMAITVATLLAAVFIHNHGLKAGRLEGKLALSQLGEQLEKARNTARDAQETHQRQMAAETDRINNEHAQAMADLQRNAVADRAESDGLRGKLASLQDRLRRESSLAPGSGQQLTSATKAAMVLSDLLSSCSGARSELAGALDVSYARGRAVEAQYDRVRGQ